MVSSDILHLSPLLFLFLAFYSLVRFSNNEMGGPIAVVKAGAQMAEYSPTALIGK